MKQDNSYILTINGRSSSIQFSFYPAGEPLKRGLHGKCNRLVRLHGKPNMLVDMADLTGIRDQSQS